MHGSTRRSSRRRAAAAFLGLVTLAIVATALPSAAAKQSAGSTSQGVWQLKSDSAFENAKGETEIAATELQAVSVNKENLRATLAAAPAPDSDDELVISLPDPNGDFQRFAIRQSQIMAPGLAAKHPDIGTYRGHGLDDPTATIHADLSRIGFHASVRSSQGAWYIDPFSHSNQSVYASYYGRDMPKDQDGPFIERDAESAELSVDKGYYHAVDTVSLNGSGFAENAGITITISDPEGHFASRTLGETTDDEGSFETSFVADPDGNLETHIVAASDGTGSASTSYQVVRADDPTSDPPTGDVLRTYRLALITDPGYSNYFGGPANVTPAKVALMNRVSQVYEDDLSIAIQMIANNDLLNLNTWAAATAPNGPCGAAACYAQSNVTGCSALGRNRVVAGQIVGAEAFDIGHLALGHPGGGVANLGVVGRANKAGGCTGLPTPTGDFYAIDYVAHEMGHQFSGNHPFNGNQLNCSGGNRSQATSVEPGSGSSIMAYAGICATDDLAAHSDPYFSQRSLQEISTYTSSTQAAINEVQSAALRHYGGGNEVQVATFGTGFAPTNAIQPLTVAIGAAPSATQQGGLSETGNTVTVSTGSTGATHTLQPGDSITISGAGDPGYNGTFTVDAVLTSRAFTLTNPISGLPRTGGGTITLNAPGLSEVGNTVTVRTTLVHNRSVGDQITIGGAGNAGYNQATPVTITAVPSPRSFQFTNAVAGLPNSGGGTVTFTSPFRLSYGGNDSVLIGNGGLQYNNANLTTAINGIAGFPGTATVTAATSTGFTVTFTGASAGVDVTPLSFTGLSCGGCFGSIEETNHGGAFDSFRINYGGNLSAPILNGTNYSAAGILAAVTPILPVGVTVTVQGFGGGAAVNNQGFQLTYGGTAALTNVPVKFGVQDFTPGASGFVNEFDKGGAVDNKGGIITPTGNTWPAVAAPLQYQIPLRTPFSLTGSATDAEGDPLLYAWEQNDRGGAAGTSLLSNTKTNGPLFAMFPNSAVISEADTLLYNSPGQNHITASPTRVFPDLQQILDNNTNADTGACPIGPIAPPVSVAVRDCFSEFLPTSDYVGFSGVNGPPLSPLSLHFRLTARDMKGGVNAADTTLLLTPATGPFRVTSQGSAVTYEATSTQTVTWDVAGTDLPPISTTDVKISLSLDGGHTYPYVLAASTPNDGSQAVTLPYDGSAHARIKVEALGNIYFDISNVDFTIHATPTVTNNAPGGVVNVQYSDPMPAVTVTATDPDTPGSGLTATATGLPAGATLTSATVSPGSTLPGVHTWTVGGTITAAPGTYPVTVTVTDDAGATASTSFTIVVAPEDVEIGYEGDELTFAPPKKHSEKVLLRATVHELADGSPGDIRNATVTFEENGVVLCGPLPVALMNGDLTTGTAACTVTLAVGAHDIDIVVGGYYAGEESQIVEVAEPDDSRVTASGHTVITQSGGVYRASANSKMSFGLSVKYSDGKGHHHGRGYKRESLDGHVDVEFKSGSKKYRIKSSDLDSLGVDFEKPSGASCNGPSSSKCYGLADLRATAKLYDVTRRTTTVASNLTLRVTVTDRGSHGSKDSIGITLWNGNKLLFSSKWNGTETLEQNLKSGKVYVR